MPVKRFSILIPTRDREGTLAATLKTCLMQEFDDYEIVVSDNSTTDKTQKLVAEIGSPLIRLVRPPRPLAMSDNWSFALENARGEYFTVLGSDDGLLQHALKEIDQLLRILHTKALRWECVTYLWPDLPTQQNGRANGLLIPLKQTNHFNPVYRRESKEVMRAAANYEISYAELPSAYFSMIHREVFEQIRSRTGCLFKGKCPDIYSGYAVAHTIGHFHSVAAPMGIAGLSSGSNGHGTIYMKGGTETAKDGERLDDAAHYEWHSVVPPLRVMPAYNANSFLDAKESLFANDYGLCIDRRRLAELCAAEVYPADEEEWQLARAAIRESLADAPALLASYDSEMSRKTFRDLPPLSSKPVLKRYGGNYLHLNAADFGIKDIFEAAVFCEKILGYKNEGANCHLTNEPAVSVPISDGNLTHDRSQDDAFAQEVQSGLLLPIVRALKNKTVIDAGAGRGDLIGAFLEAGVEKVFAFEPYPPHLEHLRQRFGNTERVRVRELAIGERDEQAKLRIASGPGGELRDLHHTTHAFLNGSSVSWNSETEVSCRALSSLVESKDVPCHVGLLHIDTGGSDHAIVTGMGALKADTISTVFWSDLPSVQMACPYAIPDIDALLRPRGYSNYLAIKRHGDMSTVQINDPKVNPGEWGLLLHIHDDVFAELAPILFEAFSRSQNNLAKKALEYRTACEQRLEVIKGVKQTAHERLLLINTVTQAAEERLRAINALTRALDDERRLNTRKPASRKKATEESDAKVLSLGIEKAVSKCLSHVFPEAFSSESGRAYPADLAQHLADANALLAQSEARIAQLDRENHRLRQLAGEAFVPSISSLGKALAESVKQKTIYPLLDRNPKQLGILRQYDPKPLRLEVFPIPAMSPESLPTIAVVTPSYMQGAFIERTILSLVSQNYPKLNYWVQDGGSKDDTVEIIKRHADRLAGWESIEDAGQASAVTRGFKRCKGDIMAWLNSDDMLMPGALRYVGEYFAANPTVDVVYGHRVIVDENDNEVGRWALPRHDPFVMRFADYVPQESLFWRAELWEEVGGLDASFQFALDWDMIMRFQEAGAKIVRLPYFLGCFRIHPSQKTSASMTNSMGDHEMSRIRERLHGRPIDWHDMGPHIRRYCRKSSAIAYLLSLGIRR